MFTNENIVAIVFKLINFTIFIGLVAFIFKKYLKADILFLIAKKESDHQNLLTQQTMLEHKQQSLDLLAQEEAIQYQDLKSKIDEWKKVIDLEQQHNNHEFNKFVVLIKKRNAEIVQKQKNQRIQNTIIDKIVTDLEKSLMHDFKDSKKSADYLNQIVAFMKEKTS